jgi:hypothetical protein
MESRAIGDGDATDKKLVAKARTKLLDQGLSYRSPAMLDTPRRRLEARALRGHWDRFVEAATELGSRAWRPILTMAKAAFDADKRPLAMSIFAAADQPGPHRDHLRAECVKMLCEPPPAVPHRRVTYPAHRFTGHALAGQSQRVMLVGGTVTALYSLERGMALERACVA